MIIISKNINTSSINYLEKIAFLFFISLPIFFIIGSFFVNCSLAILSLTLIIFLSKKKIFFEKKKLYIFYFFVIFLILNSLLSSYPTYVILKSLSYLRFIFFVIIGIYFLNTIFDKYKYKIIFFNLFILIFVILDLFVQLVFGLDLFGFKVDHTIAYGRLSGPFGSEYIVGSFLFAFGLITYALLSLHTNFRNYLQIIYLITLFISIFITGERNAFLCSVIFIILLFFINKELRGIAIISVFIAGLTCLAITKHNKYLSDRYSFNSIPLIKVDQKIIQSNEDSNTSTEIIVSENFFKTKKKFLTQNHWYKHYLAGMQLFKENLILGVGFKTFRFECLNIKNKDNILCTTHPHNIYVELLSDTGLIGFLLFLSLFLKIIYSFFSQKLYRVKYTSILFALCMAFIFPFKPHGSIFSTNNAMLFFLILTYLIWSIFFNKINNEK